MMAWSTVLLVTLVLLSTNPTFSFSVRFPNLDTIAGAGHSLLGDAHLVDGNFSVQLTHRTPSSFGMILRNTPFNFTSSTSFSSTFQFEIGNGVALVIIPSDFPSKFAKNTSINLVNVNRFIGVEFDSNLCRIVSSRVRVSNASKTSNVLKSGVTLSAWIDYHAVLKRIDVRLSKLGHPKAVDALISYRVDLGEMWKGEEVLLGLASSNGNQEQTIRTRVYYLRSTIKGVPKWMHSIPVNPKDHSTVLVDKRANTNRGCFLSGFMFAMGCGAVAAMALFLVSSCVGESKKVASVSPAEFKYEKVSVLEMKNSETATK